MPGGEEQKPSLAFTFQKKKVVQKVAANVDERKDNGQLISGFDGAKAQVVGGDSGAENKTFVIPKLENTFKTGGGPKKFTPSFKPPSGEVVKLADGEDKFVQAASTVPVITEYGLQLRDVKPADRAEAAAASNGTGGNIAAAVLEERAFRNAVEELPDVADVEAYESMPVEEFGRAMLRGMGWEEGMGVGRNRRQVEAIEYVRRPERLGLGAQPVKLGEDPGKPVKMGDKPRKQDLVLAPDADGRQRNIRTLDEQLVQRSAVLPGPKPGKAMRILGGPHAGLGCTALEALPKLEGRPERWRVRLSASNEDVEVLVSELGEKWEKEQGRRDAAGGGVSGSARGRDEQGERDPDQGRGGRREGSAAAAVDAGEPGSSFRGAGEAAGAPASRRGASDADERRQQEHDRERMRDSGKRKHRDRGHSDDERPGGEDGARGGKKTRGSHHERGHDDDDGGGGDRHGKKHRKHEEKDKKGKKDKKDKRGKHERKHSRPPQETSSGSEADEADRRPSGPTWLFPSIKVRVVDKQVRGGKLYLKKGTVVDVHPGGSADVALDDTRDVLRLPQSSLETVVPRHEGAVVLVVAGPHRGSRGRLLQASTSAGAAAVQLAVDFTIVRLMLDDVAGYVGEMEEE